MTLTITHFNPVQRPTAHLPHVCRHHFRAIASEPVSSGAEDEMRTGFMSAKPDDLTAHDTCRPPPFTRFFVVLNGEITVWQGHVCSRLLLDHLHCRLVSESASAWKLQNLCMDHRGALNPGNNDEHGFQHYFLRAARG